MAILIVITSAALIISAISDYKKTLQGIKKGLKMFIGILPVILSVLLLVSMFLYIVPEKVLISWLGKNSGINGIAVAALIGSISLIPGIIAYPLSAILLKNGVSYHVLAVFITTLMMVGILTLPIEAKYFGMRTSILRNLLSFIGAVIVGVLIGVFI